MDSYSNMNFDGEPVRDSNDIRCRLKEEICILKRKLESYDEMVAERNDLRDLCKEFEEYNKKNEIEHQKVLDEMLNTLDKRTKKLKKCQNSEILWEKKYDEQQNYSNCLEDNLNALKIEVTDLQIKLEDSEKERKCLQKDLCSAKMELADKIVQIEKLNFNLKCKEEELSKLRKKFDECRNERCRLDEANKILEVDLERANKNLCDEKSRTKCLEEKCKRDLEYLKNELKEKCQKLSETELQLESMCHRLNDANSKVKLLTTSLKDLKEASEKSLCNMKSQLQKLKAEINVKEEEICHMRKQVKDLQREKEFTELELNAQKNKLYEKECQLKQMKILSEKIGQIKQSCVPCPSPPVCCPVKKCEKPCGTSMADSSPSQCCKNLKSLMEKYLPKPNCNSNSDSSLKNELKKMNCQLEDLKKDVCEIRKNKC